MPQKKQKNKTITTLNSVHCHGSSFTTPQYAE